MICRFCQNNTNHHNFTLYCELNRVSSDSKPQPKGGKLTLCHQCLGLTKPIDNNWSTEVENIYNSYSIYQQGDGSEASVFKSSDGASQTRSHRLCELLQQEIINNQILLPNNGRLLDIGCGGGPFLKEFGSLNPNWTMVGSEINTSYIKQVESIPNVEKMYTGAVSDIPGSFNVISLVHVFEHVIEITETLRVIHEKLLSGGILLIEVPDYTSNPFDLLITDHCNHFSVETLKYVLECHNFEIIYLTNQWIQKEITLLAKPTKHKISKPTPSNVTGSSVENHISKIESNLLWLKSVITSAEKLQGLSEFGIFGSSNAAGWLLGSISKKPTFLVDEDPSRSGGKHLGISILNTIDVPSGSTVFIPLSPIQAVNVQKRLMNERVDVQWLIP